MSNQLTLKEALLLFLGSESRKPETKRSYERILTGHIEFLGPDRLVTSVKRTDLVAWQDHLKEPQVLYKRREGGKSRRRPFAGKLSLHTVHKRLKTASVFWNWLKDEGEIEESPMKRLKIDKPPKPKVSRRRASIQTLCALAAVMRNDPRDWALFCFLLDTGCRAIGLSNLLLSGLDLEQGIAYTTEKLDKEHTAVFEKVTAKAIQGYLEVRPKNGHREVFLSTKGEPMNDSTLRSWLYRRCDKAGVKRIGPHALRRSVGCHLALMRVPLSLIQEHMGHSTAEITARYYMPDDEDELREMLARFGLLKEVLGDDFEMDGEDEEAGDEGGEDEA